MIVYIYFVVSYPSNHLVSDFILCSASFMIAVSALSAPRVAGKRIRETKAAVFRAEAA
jgi:hypothetical protein